MSGDHEPVAGERPAPTGNLAPVALGLGIGGLLLGIIPFYGTFFALPLNVVAVVLALTARARPWENRRQALAGLVTGGIGLLFVVGWAGWLAWNQFGFGTFASQSSIDVASGEAMAPATVHASPGAQDASPSPDASPNDAPLSVTPGDAGDGLVGGLSGEAELTIDGATRTITLSECALDLRSSTGTLVRGEGPDARLAVARPHGFNTLFLDVEGEDAGTFVGSTTGLSSQSGGVLLRRRHRFELDGQLRDLYSDEVVDVRLVVTCS